MQNISDAGISLSADYTCAVKLHLPAFPSVLKVSKFFGSWSFQLYQFFSSLVLYKSLSHL